jgi:hypothetical protein
MTAILAAANWGLFFASSWIASWLIINSLSTLYASGVGWPWWQSLKWRRIVCSSGLYSLLPVFLTLWLHEVQ